MSAASGLASGSRAASALPRRIGKYHVVTQLGEGGQARVYLAYLNGPAGFHKLVVIKVLRDDLEDEIHAQSLRHEARLAGLLSHPNVVQTHEVGETAEGLFIAMEYVDGASLGAIHKKLAPKRLPLVLELRILVDVARALHHAHTLRGYDGTELKIVHRDVSPHNVMIAYDGQVKLVDFGIAKAQGSDDLTRQGIIKGKVAYMSPEQLAGGAIDHRADIFALGVMMWQAVTGRRFAGGAGVSELTKIHNRLAGAEPRLREAAPNAPSRLVEICDKALSVDPEARHASAEQLADELAEYLADSSLTAHRELADVLRPLFAAERERMRALIDERLREANATSDEADVLTGDGEHHDAHTHSRASGIERVSRPRGHGPDGTAPAAADERRAHAMGAGALPEVEVALEPAPRRAPRVLAVLATVTAIAGVAVAITRGGDVDALRTSTPAPATSDADETPRPGVETEAAVAPVAPVETVELRVRAVPADARATLDGERVALPLELTLPRSSATRELVVSAAGHEPERRIIGLESDVDLVVELARSARGRERSFRPAASRREVAPVDPTPEREAPSPAVDAPAPIAPTPPARRSPAIDTEDPYR